ncbi:MAG TPA: MerR family transcriptional regulator [Paludibacteraceae bacterium]|jgi:DNA-binding transcriptional MerR regulator|nr:MerR family transcriptional regulator [Paludibacteraceae bacterium]HQB68855.1 MerR family transcriptional regulator [Paludibacteraceae bacterium]HRS68013.1 MerR family transcriptional regulator [Paludibacteraceae bacterium]
MEKVYYSIAEVAKMFDVNQSLLRFWEDEFDQLKPKRNAKGTRFYTADNIDTIKQIHYLLRVQKLTIAGAKERLKSNHDSVVKQQKIREKLVRIRKELIDIRYELNQNEAVNEEILIP